MIDVFMKIERWAIMINNKTIAVSGENKLGIRDVLEAHGFDLHSKFRLVRHAPDFLEV